MFDGFYKCEYHTNDVAGRSVMYVHAGRMLGGNTAFAHVGSYREEADGDITAEIAGQRHHVDPSFRTLFGSDTAILNIRGRAYGNTYRFEGGSAQMPGAVFRSVMTRIDDDISAPVRSAGEGGIVNGLYSTHLTMLDGLDGDNSGVMLLHDGRILGGDAYFYYLGSYTSANGRWKGAMLNQEHTPTPGERSLFGGYEVGIGFSGTCDQQGAGMEATALAGKRSMRFTARLSLLHRA